MVYEDALTILSYASPYEVIVEAKRCKTPMQSPAQSAQPGHPLFRSSSSADVLQVSIYLVLYFSSHIYATIFADRKVFQKAFVPT